MSGLRRTIPGIYAIGNVTGGPAFNHISYDDFRILRTNLIDSGDATTNGRLVPYTVFTDPQLGRVGWSETETRKQGRAVMHCRHADGRCGQGHRGRRNTRLPESGCRCRERSDPWLRGARSRGWGDDGGGADRGDGQAPVHRAARRQLAHPTLAESLNTRFTALDS